MSLTRNQQRRRGGGASGAITFDMDMSGLDGVRELLKAMPATLRNGIVQPIVTTLVQAGARVAKQNLVRILPKRDPATRRWDRPTGALRDSLGSKVVPNSRMRNKGVVFGLYGARLDFRVSKQTQKNVSLIRGRPQRIGRLPRGTPKGTVIAPYKYIHLVERGHRALPQFNIPAARPYPFMGATRQAMLAVIPIMIRSRFATLYPQQMSKLTRRYMRRVGTIRPGGRS